MSPFLNNDNLASVHNRVRLVSGIAGNEVESPTKTVAFYS